MACEHRVQKAAVVLLEIVRISITAIASQQSHGCPASDMMLSSGPSEGEGGAMLPIRLRLELGPRLLDGQPQRLVYPVPTTVTTIGQLVQQVSLIMCPMH
jgi:hypothetical protein